MPKRQDKAIQSDEQQFDNLRYEDYTHPDQETAFGRCSSSEVILTNNGNRIANLELLTDEHMELHHQKNTNYDQRSGDGAKDMNCHQNEGI